MTKRPGGAFVFSCLVFVVNLSLLHQMLALVPCRKQIYVHILMQCIRIFCNVFVLFLCVYYYMGHRNNYLYLCIFHLNLLYFVNDVNTLLDKSKQARLAYRFSPFNIGEQ